MSDRYPHVFSPVTIGPVEVKNRFYFSPHGNLLSAGWHPSEDFAHYYAERAAGGCGLLIQSLPAVPRELNRQGPFVAATVPSYAAVADLVHERGARIFGQLHYWWSAGRHWEPRSPLAPSIGPSPSQRFDDPSVTRALTRREIRMLVDCYRQSARHLGEAGYDGIELHVAHGILPEQFLSPYWNRRADEYGGSLENRMRLVVELLTAIRESVGAGLAVGVRFNCDEMTPNGWTQDDARDILARLVAAGLIDFADLDIATEPNQFPLGMPSYYVPPFTYRSFVAAVRDAAGDLPVLSVLGRITEIAMAEEALASGVVDLVGATRGLIAEPYLVKNALEGREDRSRKCIACNWCLAAGRIGASGCTINPTSQRERHWGAALDAPAPERRKVVVVGGGPAGLEAARVAATRGHDVVLFEQREQVGGQLALWAALPSRDALAAHPRWELERLRELGVDVRTGSVATPATVLDEAPGAVVVATGGRYAGDGESGFLALPIPGHERPFVYTPEDVLERGVRPAGRVLVLDDEGLNTGVGVCEVLAAGGADVELVTRWLQPVNEMLVYSTEFAFILPTLEHAGVRISTRTYVKQIDDGRVTVYDVFTNRESVREDISAVVLSTMRRPVDELSEALEGQVDQLFVIGDALAPRGLAEAGYEGHKFARLIGEPGAPADFAEAYFQAVSDDAFAAPAMNLARRTVATG